MHLGAWVEIPPRLSEAQRVESRPGRRPACFGLDSTCYHGCSGRNRAPGIWGCAGGLTIWHFVHPARAALSGPLDGPQRPAGPEGRRARLAKSGRQRAPQRNQDGPSRGPGAARAPGGPAPAALGGPGPGKTQERGTRQRRAQARSGHPRPPQRKGARPQPAPAGPPTQEATERGGAPDRADGAAGARRPPKGGRRARPGTGGRAEDREEPAGAIQKSAGDSPRHRRGGDEHEANGAPAGRPGQGPRGAPPLGTGCTVEPKPGRYLRPQARPPQPGLGRREPQQLAARAAAHMCGCRMAACG